MASLFADLEEDEPEEVVDIAVDAEPEELTPRSNPVLLGHEEVEQSLLMDYNAGRLPHAIVLSGLSGIGKATMAYRLVRFLLAQSDAGLFGDNVPAQSMDIPPDHPVFRRVVSGGHADMMVIERERDEKKNRLKNDISVESVRRIHPFLQKTAAEGGWRAVIVDGAESLNASSQNALLKMLEEPPKKTILILTTTKPGAFLPTIRSRCRMIQMNPLSDDVMDTLLDQYVSGLGSDDKYTLTQMAGGSIGRALRYYQDDGLALHQELASIVATLPDLDMVKVHDLATRIGGRGSSGAAYDIVCDMLSEWCRQEVESQARGQESHGVLALLANTYAPYVFFETWEKVTTLFHQAEAYNLDKKQAIINAFLVLKDPHYRGLQV